MCCLTIYLVVLFVLLSPGILVTLPPKGGKWVVAIVHAAVFAIVAFFTCGPVTRLFSSFGIEGFESAPTTAAPTTTPIVTTAPTMAAPKKPEVNAVDPKFNVDDGLVSGEGVFANAVAKSGPAPYK